MKWIRKEVLSGKPMAGTFLNLGSPITAEIAGRAGFDWVLIDMEHGAGAHSTLIHQLQAVAATPAAPIVRIEWNEPPRFKRVLDLGPSGVMVPYVNNAGEARQAVAAMRYPPAGVRGIAGFTPATHFGQEFKDYYAKADDALVTILQIETAEAVANVTEIAAVEGVDVLFVGPLDLSVNLGHAGQFDHPEFRAAVTRVIEACRDSGKIAGTLVMPDKIGQAIQDGYTFIAVGSEGGAVTSGLKSYAAAFEKYR